MNDLALFPLHSVLYPGMAIRLHVFETRYKRMLRECLEGDRTFGVVLIKRGLEAFGPPPEPCAVGCQAVIHTVEPLPDGRINLIALGQQRIRIDRLTQLGPFLKAQIEALPMHMAPGFEPDTAADRLRTRLARYLVLLGQLQEQEANAPDLPVDAEALAYSACSLVQLPLEEKQALLEIDELESLLGSLDAALKREVALLGALLERGPSSMLGTFGLN